MENEINNTVDNPSDYTRKKPSSGGARAFLSKLSKGLMLPIALLPVAGLFLGIGAGIINIMDTVGLDSSTNPWYLIPELAKDIGNIIFVALPVLFAIAIAIAFTEDAGIAAFSGFVGWLIFSATQSALIFPNLDDNGILLSYTILWYKDAPTSVVGQTLGINSLQTSVFGGITVGLVVAWIYNRFNDLKLPTVLGFFNGTRSVPIITFLFIPLVSFIFLATWPLIGHWLDQFGTLLLSMPYGIDAFLFGVIERSLVPFGLHHAFYTPLWFTSVGGQLIAINASSQIQSLTVASGDQTMWFAIQNYGLDYNSLGTQYWVTPPDGLVINNSQFNSGDYWIFDPTGGTGGTDINNYLVDVTGDSALQDGQYVFLITENAHPGQYLQGKYAFMIFGLPAAGAAMVVAAKKENRQMAFSIIGAAALTSFLTGITEPIEFTFLFLAPLLYIIHVFLAGISFWLADLLQMSVGMTFSGGIIDYIIYGVVPLATGYNTAAWIVIPIGIAYIPIYYFIFYFYITKRNIETPGRGNESSEIKLVSKADYLKSKDEKKQKKISPEVNKKIFSENNPRFERTVNLLGYLGDFDNLKSIDACITKLRIVVNDVSKLQEDKLKAMGAKGVIKLGGGSVQVVFGVEADIFKGELLKLKKQGFTYKEWSSNNNK